MMEERRAYRRKKSGGVFRPVLAFAVLLAILAAVIRFAGSSGDTTGTVEDPESIAVFVNKSEGLPEDYVPPDLVECGLPSVVEITAEEHLLREEAAGALRAMFAAAKDGGFTLYIVSGYRSYGTQKAIYERVKSQKGEVHANLYVALPGHSEHQTGLAMDLTNVEHQDEENDRALGTMPEGIWLRDNAHRFGFILRYPEDKTDVTGYNYEPWHFRYVGRETAGVIHENNWTLEEFMQSAGR